MVGVGNHHAHRITHVPYGVQCKKWMRRRLVRFAVFAGDGPAADQPTHSGFRDVGTGVHSHHAGHLRCRGGIDTEGGMGVRGTDEIGVGLAGAIHVVQVPAIAGEKSVILFAAHRSADSRISHDYFPPSRIARAPA